MLDAYASNSQAVLEESATLQLVAENLHAMISARRQFLSNEADEKLRRALLHQTLSSDVYDIQNRDHDYYKRDIANRWEGPGTVIGNDGKQVLIQHGSTSVRVHSSRLQYAPLSMSKRSWPKLLKYLQSTNVIQSYCLIKGIHDLAMECYSDATFGSFPDGVSHGRFFSFIVDGKGSSYAVGSLGSREK